MIKRTLGILMILAAAPLAAGAESTTPVLSEAGSSARRDLEASLGALTALREQIQAEKVPLTRELSRLEDELTVTRREIDETSRGQDAKRLEQANLETALKLRQEEASYVTNLLDEFVRGFESILHPSEYPRYGAAIDAAKLAKQNLDLPIEETHVRQGKVITEALDRVDDILGGTCYAGEAVDTSGQLAHGRFAMVGPVVLFAADRGISGLAVAQAGSVRSAVRPLPEGIGSGVASIVEGKEGLLPLDPSKGGALQEFMHRASLLHYFKKGGPIMYPLLFVSLLAFTVIIERLVFLSREKRFRDRSVVGQIFEHVARGDLDGAIGSAANTRDFVARTLRYAIEHRHKGLQNALARAAGQEVVRFSRGISILDTCVTAAPLLGLLGTVTGMMGSFGMLGGAELSAPAQITGGIAEALIATAFGLGIAITCLIPMNYLHGKADAAKHEIEDASTHLELLMKPLLEREFDTSRPSPSRGRLAQEPESLTA